MPIAAGASARRSAPAALSGAAEFIAGGPGARDEYFLARSRGATLLGGRTLGLVRSQHIAVHLAPATAATLAPAAGAAGGLVTDTVEGGQFARLAVVHTGPGLGRTARRFIRRHGRGAGCVCGSTA
ncbi:MAG TPA: hypothetical protein PLN91_10470, partial [Rhodanobacteraceae bacterium]|nr:hypothetical protein [Rhodanobacteraceae bacterium]